MRTIIAVAVLAASLSALAAGTARAQLGYHDYRHIHINGVHLTPEQIAQYDALLGYEIPSGFYWVDTETGEWGYEGVGEVLGSIYHPGDPRRQAASGDGGSAAPAGSGGRRPIISNDSGTGSAIIDPNPGGCSYVSSGGMTMRVCD